MEAYIFKFKKAGGMGTKNCGNLLVFIFALFPLALFSQNDPQVSASVDSTQIKIGEQVIYSISVETNPDNLVVFPEGQSFSPLEMVEAYKTDTTRAEGRFLLLKEYALTQFDSGRYTIPRQRVVVDDEDLFTDSFLIEVADVAVDTTSQEFYPIKPAVEVSAPFTVAEWVWWLLGALVILGVLLFLFFRRKKRKKAEAAKLPPYEQALVELEQLDQSHLLEDRELKEYYSQLTDVVRKYLDEQVYDRAMESTTGELITFLEMKKDADELRLSDEVISDLKTMLQRADLAKFANSRPDVITARSDRASAEKIINGTRTAVPEPTEEELLRDQKYQEELERKRKKRKIALGIVGGIIVVVVAVSAFVASKGFTYVKDVYFGNESRELLVGEWINSAYGRPAIAITTPEVLVRESAPEIKKGAIGTEKGTDVFSYGTVYNNIFIKLSTTFFAQPRQTNLAQTVDRVAETLEEQGAKNILVKDEAFTAQDGSEGIKISGSFKVEDPISNRELSKNYVQVNFAARGGVQSIFVSYDDNDEYAEEMAQRIINSVEFQNSN